MCRAKQSKREDVIEAVAPMESTGYSEREESSAYLDETDLAKYSRSGTFGDGSAYEPLQLDQLGHHSYSKSTSGQATEGGLDDEYTALDVTNLQDTQYAELVAMETSGKKNEYVSSLDLEDAAPKKTKLHKV